jgi:hypothetical protein
MCIIEISFANTPGDKHFICQPLLGVLLLKQETERTQAERTTATVDELGADVKNKLGGMG